MRARNAIAEDGSSDTDPGKQSRGNEGRAHFEDEVAPLMPQLHRLCLTLCRERQEAEDLLQDALVRAYLHRDSFQGRGSLLGWLCGIIRNQFVENRRAVARRRSLLETVLTGASSVLGSLFTGGAEQPDPEVQLGHSEQAALLLRCLHALPEKFRLVVLLCDVEELGYEEVSSILGVPVGTVKSRHFRGRSQLSAAFKSFQVPAPHEERAEEEVRELARRQ
ncbi:RNA polymerase sigma factor [Hyalangium versicolor]|uniref:RNA polymerase sigma factor n=1 Tax=Hyalangium versicolor TaxID=2861190 RepID=UPI001CCEAE8C|nr:RNA polymerase sigma factor [Hyalangium versicolor]